MIRQVKKTLLVTALLASVASTGCNYWSPQAKKARFLASGKAKLEKKDYARAMLDLKNAIRLAPKEAEPYYQLSLAYLATNDPRTAAALLMKTAELDPKHSAAQLKLAELMSTSRNPEILKQAQDRLQQVLRDVPDNPDALGTLAVTEAKLGDLEDAEKHLQEALQKFPKHLRSSVALAQMKLIQRDLPGAEAVLKKAVEQDPKAASPLLALGGFYIVSRRLPEAEAQYRKALELDPKNALALRSLGVLEFRTGRADQAEKTYKRISELPDKEYRHYHAVFLVETGKTDAGIAELDKIYRSDLNDREARSRLVGALANAGRSQEAQNLLAEALKKNAKDTQALMQRSQIYIAAGKLAEAQSDLTEVLRSRPDSAEAHYAMARVHRLRGATQKQSQELTEALRLNPRLLAARLDLARAFISTGGANDALALLAKTPEVERNSLPVLETQNWAQMALGRGTEARAGVDRGLKAARTRDLLLQDAILKLRQKDYNSARGSLEEVLKANPEDLRALSALASSYAAQNQLPTALKKTREYAEQRPKSARLQMFLAKSLWAAGRDEEARAAFEAAKAADPKSPAADLELARMDLADNKLDAARQRVQPLADANAAAAIMMATIEERAGNVPGAIGHLNKAIELQPDNALALNNLAYHLAETGRPDEALKHAQRAKELAPNSIHVDDTIGWAYYQKGIYKTAMRHFEIAVAKESKAIYNYHLAMACLKGGELTRGQQVLQTAVKLDPKLPEAKVAMQLLAEAKAQK